MNLNKLFPQFKIRKKLTIAFIALAIIPMFLTGLFGVNYTINQLEKNALQQLKSDVTTAQVKVDRFLNQAKSDIFYLRDSFVFKAFVEHLTDANSETLKARTQTVKQLFQDFAQNKQIYYQLRVLDRFAREMIRIEYDGQQAAIIPDEQLTTRKDVFYRYYLESHADQELLFTPVELINKKIPEEIVPAISYFLPIYEASDHSSPQGVLIANVYAQKLFDLLQEDTPNTGRKTILTDNEGYYIFNSQKSEWNKMLALRKEGNVDNDYPKSVRDLILSGSEGIIVENWDEIIAYAPIYFADADHTFMVLFQCLPRASIHASIKSFMKLVLLLGSVIFTIALILGVLAANQFTKPIKALSKSSEMLAKGRLDYRIEIDTNDEIEQLANDFNNMASKLKAHEKKLKDHAGELENKVLERTHELSKTLSYLQNLIDSSIDAIITLDNDRKITFFSQGAEEILGYRSEEMVGKEICTLCSSCILDKCPIVGVSKRQKKFRSFQMDFVNKRGQQLPITISASPIQNETGATIGILTISKDMSEQKRMEHQIQQAEKLAGIGRLAAGLAHQLNTPLASIILAVQLLSEMTDDGEMMADLKSVKRQADYCKKIIQDLLSFSRPSQHQKYFINLKEAISATINLFENNFYKKNIRVKTVFEADDVQLYANANQVEQLFFNLLMNAADAMPKGGLIRIRVSVETDRKIRITIQDKGTGIAKKNLNKIFEPFFTTKDVGKGTGLGLSVCYGIVQEYGGTIRAESKRGKGTTFTICFPNNTEHFDMNLQIEGVADKNQQSMSFSA